MWKMAHLSSVQSGLTGLLSLRKRGLLFYPEFNIVTRTPYGDSKRDQVRVVSGGGGGHEPMHCGFVGHGLLTTAISGELFTSPSVRAILNGILVTAPPTAPFLLIVTNYTGDRLNFSLAEEMARVSYGYEIATILVADDVALDNVPATIGSRGLAGTVLVHKIAGAMAASNRTLKEIHSLCSEVNVNLSTVGFSFEYDCKQKQLKNIEIGKGVHGEKGALNLPDQSNFDNIIEFMMNKFGQRLTSGSELVVLINNLGGTSNHLMQLFSGAILAKLELTYGLVKIISGSLFTSLGSQGISVTVLSLGNSKSQIINYLEMESEIFWDHFKPNIGQHKSEIVHQIPLENIVMTGHQKGFKFPNSDRVRQISVKICDELIAVQPILDEMDQEFGDGDTGTTLARGATSLRLYFNEPKNDLLYAADVFQNISSILSSSMGGTSGCLLGIYFQSAASVFTDEESMSEPAIWSKVLEVGNSSVAKAGRAKRGDRTMLDVLLAAEDVLKAHAHALGTVDLLTNLTRRCDEAANETISMRAKSGRATYATADEIKTPTQMDPGAEFVALVFRTVTQMLLD